MIIVDRRMNNRAPGKRKGQARGRRVIDGELALDIPGASKFRGWTESSLRGQIKRRTVPFHRQGPRRRIYFLRDELEKFVRDQPGCTPEEAAANVLKRKDA